MSACADVACAIDGALIRGGHFASRVHNLSRRNLVLGLFADSPVASNEHTRQSVGIGECVLWFGAAMK